MPNESCDNLNSEPVKPTGELDCAPTVGAESQSELAKASPDGEMRNRREFLGKSGKLLIYVPPVIQLFIPTKALAASPSS